MLSYRETLSYVIGLVCWSRRARRTGLPHLIREAYQVANPLLHGLPSV